MELTEIVKIVIWPATLLLFSIFFTVIFRPQIGELLKKIVFKFKKGDSELEVTQQVTESKVEKQIAGNSTSTPAIQEENPKVLVSDSKSPDELMDEMTSAILDGKFEKGESLYKQLQESERDPVEKSRREGIYYYFLFQRGDTSALSKITELTKNPDVSHYAHYWLGLCYETSQDFDRALAEFKLAVEKAKSQERRAIYVVSCARSIHESRKKNDALKYIMAEIASTSEANALATLYNGIASLYLMEESYELRGLALEKAIEYQPNDSNLLFQVAYSYSQAGCNELSLLYYNTLLHFSPEYDMALNNIGVAYSRLNMPIKSIDHHKKAFDFGNTLAASNIALGYINAGFSDEARLILEKAREQKDVHRNVGSTFSEIIDKKEIEQKQEKEALESAREQQRFLRSFGEAYFVQAPEIPDINDIWTFPDGTEVTIVQQKEAFTIEWTENKQAYGLKGNLVNRAAQLNVTAPNYRVNDDTSSKLFITPDYKSINLMIKRFSNFEYKKLAKKQQSATTIV